jgi:hypothetical protein
MLDFKSGVGQTGKKIYSQMNNPAARDGVSNGNFKRPKGRGI